MNTGDTTRSKKMPHLSMKTAIGLTIGLPTAGIVVGSILGAVTAPPTMLQVGALGFTSGLELMGLALVLVPHLIATSNSGNRWAAFGYMLVGFFVAASIFFLVRLTGSRWKPNTTGKIDWSIVTAVLADFLSDGVVIGLAAATDPLGVGVAIMVSYFIDGLFLAFTQLSEARDSSLGAKIAVPIAMIVARLAPALLIFYAVRGLTNTQSMTSTAWGQMLLGFALAAYATVVEGVARQTTTIDEICVANDKGDYVIDPNSASKRTSLSTGCFLVAVVVMMALAWRSSGETASGVSPV